nr:MAG TPA: hypothetical protein [Bacteriophage sp.]
MSFYFPYFRFPGQTNALIYIIPLKQFHWNKHYNATLV